MTNVRLSNAAYQWLSDLASDRIFSSSAISSNSVKILTPTRSVTHFHLQPERHAAEILQISFNFPEANCPSPAEPGFSLPDPKTLMDFLSFPLRAQSPRSLARMSRLSVTSRQGATQDLDRRGLYAPPPHSEERYHLTLMRVFTGLPAAYPSRLIRRPRFPAISARRGTHEAVERADHVALICKSTCVGDIREWEGRTKGRTTDTQALHRLQFRR